jgi:glutamate/tyrosine decarboxylase-like PLP-dependent enzyme
MSSDPEPLFDLARRHALAFRRSLPERPNTPDAGYPEMRLRVRAPLPETGGDAEAIISELVELSEPGLMAIPGPRFFGWVMGSSMPVGVAADWLVSAWGQNSGYHTPTPAMAAIEETTETWLLDLLDLPRESAIGFVTGATVANATALTAARGEVLRKAGWDAEADGLFGAPPIAVFIGADAHSSLFSSLQMIGLGSARARLIETDDQGRMLAKALETAMAATGGPKIVIAQAGQINTGAFDPFPPIADLCDHHGAWLHVDGAFGLWARAAPALKSLTQGIERADSLVTDGHKWLQAPYDTGFAIVRDREALVRAMTNWSSYLPAIASGDRVPSNYTPELSRRARATPVWAIIKALGRDGIAEMVETHCALARLFAELLAAESGVTVMNEVVLNQVIVRFGPDNPEQSRKLTTAVIARVQEDGTCFAGGAEWRGYWVMRLSVISAATTEADIVRSAEAILGIWRAIRDEFVDS